MNQSIIVRSARSKPMRVIETHHGFLRRAADLTLHTAMPRYAEGRDALLSVYLCVCVCVYLCLYIRCM